LKEAMEVDIKESHNASETALLTGMIYLSSSQPNCWKKRILATPAEWKTDMSFHPCFIFLPNNLLRLLLRYIKKK